MKNNVISIDENIERVAGHVNQPLQHTPDGLPLFSWLEISPVDMCNRACVFCPRSDPSVAPNLNLQMPDTLVDRLTGELADLDYRGTVMFAGYGEPMMHRRIAAVVARFAKVSRVEITTNGDFLSIDRIRHLADAGIAMVVVSLYDGPAQRDRIAELFLRANVPSSMFVLRERWAGSEENFGLKLTNRAGTVTVGDQAPVDQTKTCFYPHYFMMLDWNGDVYLCPQDWNRRIKVGNVGVQSLLEVWQGAPLARFRRLLGQGRRIIAPCDKCNATGSIQGRKHAEAWDVAAADRARAASESRK